MKQFVKYVPILFMVLTFNSCSENDDFVNDKSIKIDNAGIESIIKTLEYTTNSVKKNSLNNLNDNEIGEIFVDHYDKNYSTRFIQSEQAKSIQDFSSEYVNFVSQIGNIESFQSSDNYIMHLTNLDDEIRNSNISTSEKTNLINRIALNKALIDWIDSTVNSQKSITIAKDDDWDWWDTTKCIIGSTGMAGMGAVAGAGVGGAGCTVVLPIIGTVACGTVGAVVGGVSGAMVGVATFC